VANQATLTVAAACLGFLFLGKLVSKALGITQADFRIAGGVILLVLAAQDLLSV
jgi:multiple antibiotic resistance protein